jgi:subfamily B ATP-binding cassette protein MsbA
MKSPAIMERTQSNNVLTALRLGIRSMRRHPALAALFIAVTLVQGSLQGLLVWSLREVLLTFGRVQTDSLSDLGFGVLMILAIWVLLAATAFAAEVVSAQLAHRVEIESMWEVLTKLLQLSIHFFDKRSQGNLVMAAYHDLKGIRSVTLQVGQMALYLTRLAGLAVVAWLMSPKLAIIGLVTVPLGALPAHWLGQRITQASARELAALTTLHDSFLQVGTGIRTIKVNRGERGILDRARVIRQELYRQTIRQVQHRGLARFLLEAASGLGLVLVLTIGGHDVATGAMQWQSLLSLLIAVMAVYSPIVGLLQIYSTIRGVIPNLNRVEQILYETPEIQDHPQAQRLREAPQTIEISGVRFVYEGRTILDAISATFFQGETIGIVGPSGAGKSTLLSLLLRFYDPVEGAILLDGVDLRDIKHADLMDLCAIVMQEPFLFVDTVANNIRLGRPDASLEDVIAAAKAANIHDEIMQMEQGYDTILGRRNDARGVSVGQKQRICIAAALLKNAPLLFLDEATSSLDSLSEQKVQAAIERLMRGRTTFVIAHRLSTLRNADRVIVLEQGRIVGLGSHDELLATCETYRRLWVSQNGAALASALPASSYETAVET